MRAIWSGSISFGLVSIPVKLYVAIKDTRIHFNKIHAKTKAWIRYKRVTESGAELNHISESSSEGQNKEVFSHEIIKGFNIGGDQYVTFTPEEMAELAPEQSGMIEIADFVDLMKIDPIFFDTSL